MHLEWPGAPLPAEHELPSTGTEAGHTGWPAGVGVGYPPLPLVAKPKPPAPAISETPGLVTTVPSLPPTVLVPPPGCPSRSLATLPPQALASAPPVTAAEITHRVRPNMVPSERTKRASGGARNGGFVLRPRVVQEPGRADQNAEIVELILQLLPRSERWHKLRHGPRRGETEPAHEASTRKPRSEAGVSRITIGFPPGRRSATEKAFDQRDGEWGHLLHWIVPRIG